MTDRTTIELDHVERELLLCALEHWKLRLTKSEDVSASAHLFAKRFTVNRIDEVTAKLMQPATAGVTVASPETFPPDAPTK